MIDKIINVALISDWKNWLVIWFLGTFWLLAFHVVINHVQTTSKDQPFNNGPLPNGTALVPAPPMGSVDLASSNFQGIPSNNFV